MELLDKDLHIVTTLVTNSDKAKRRDALRRVYNILEKYCESMDENIGNILTESKLMSIAKTSCKALEDISESVREQAIAILNLVIEMLPFTVLDYILPSITTRIGLEDINESSEEIRLELLELSIACLVAYPNHIASRGYLDYFMSIISNCMNDSYPNIKKKACQACVTLCETEPKQVKHVSLLLAKQLKNKCLQHKHSNVRLEAVQALGYLIKHDAHEILEDNAHCQDNCTTLYFLYILCSDQSEKVRLSMIELLRIILLIITNRTEQHHRVMPHLLLLVTDSSKDVQMKANSLLLCVGKLFMMDHEDNTIDLSKRRVTMKDIESYATEEELRIYPNMTSWITTCPFDAPGEFLSRPMIGVRHVVSECCANFYESVIKDISVMDWMIPFSSVNKRVAALRILTMLVFYIEQDCIKYAISLLQPVYKILYNNEDAQVVQHAHFFIEMVGKFLKPSQYLPFLLSKNDDTIEDLTVQYTNDDANVDNVEETEDFGSIEMKRNKKFISQESVATVSEKAKNMSLFSTVALTLKASMLTAFKYFLRGSLVHPLTLKEAQLIITALCKLDVINTPDSELVQCALLDAMLEAARLLIAHGYMCSPENPIPDEVLTNIKIQTFDSKLLFAAIKYMASEYPKVKSYSVEISEKISVLVTGDDRTLFQVHLARILSTRLSSIHPDIFELFVNKNDNISTLSDPITELFIIQLSSVDYKLRVVSELQYIILLGRLLSTHKLILSSIQFDKILRLVVIPHATYHAGVTAHLFRKAALVALVELISPPYINLLFSPVNSESIDDPDESALKLCETIVSIWLGGLDSDDGEMRLTCIDGISYIWKLPIFEPELAKSIIDASIQRLDDASDMLRYQIINNMTKVLKYPNTVSNLILKSMASNIVSITKTLLIHMDDHIEAIGIKDAVKQLIIAIGHITQKCSVKMDYNIMISLINEAKQFHHCKDSCNEVIQYLENI